MDIGLGKRYEKDGESLVDTGSHGLHSIRIIFKLRCFICVLRRSEGWGREPEGFGNRRRSASNHPGGYLYRTMTGVCFSSVC